MKIHPFPAPSRLVSPLRAALAMIFALLGAAHAATVNVTQTADVVNGVTTSVAALQATPGPDGISLREAVLAVNNDPGEPHIISLPAGTFTLTIPNGADEDAAATGDLDLLKAVTITGAGSANTIVRGGTTTANGIDKIFSANPLGGRPGFPVSITGLTLRFGRNTITATSPGNILPRIKIAENGRSDFAACRIWCRAPPKPEA